jgi:hypothetical protein
MLSPSFRSAAARLAGRRGRRPARLTVARCSDDKPDIEFTRAFHAYIAERQALSAATLASLNEFAADARASRPMLPVGVMTMTEARQDAALITE